MAVRDELLERFTAHAVGRAAGQTVAQLLFQLHQLVKEHVILPVGDGGVIQHIVAVGVLIEELHQLLHSLFHLNLLHWRKLRIQFLDSLAGKGHLRDGAVDGDDGAAAKLAVFHRVAGLERAGLYLARRLLRVRHLGCQAAA